MLRLVIIFMTLSGASALATSIRQSSSIQSEVLVPSKDVPQEPAGAERYSDEERAAAASKAAAAESKSAEDAAQAKKAAEEAAKAAAEANKEADDAQKVADEATQEAEEAEKKEEAATATEEKGSNDAKNKKTDDKPDEKDDDDSDDKKDDDDDDDKDDKTDDKDGKGDKDDSKGGKEDTKDERAGKGHAEAAKRPDSAKAKAANVAKATTNAADAVANAAAKAVGAVADAADTGGEKGAKSNEGNEKATDGAHANDGDHEDSKESDASGPQADAASFVAAQKKTASRSIHAEVFPVPTSSRCIVIIVCQYMILYVALALAKLIFELHQNEETRTDTSKLYKMVRSLEASAQTMTHAPMLCVLFIACRMRVEFLSKGKGEPQLWVQNCMYALTFAMLANTLLVLVMPWITDKSIAVIPGRPDLQPPPITARFATSPSVQVSYYAMSAARYGILMCIYGGIAGIISGIHIYLPPGVDRLSEVPPPAPAIQCTMVLAVVFFLTQLVIVMCQTYIEVKGLETQSGGIHKIKHVMHGAASAVEFAPMVCILFLAARMRALQHGSQPQEWAQMCMQATTGMLCLTTFMAVLVPYVLDGKVTQSSLNEVTFDVPNSTHGYVLETIRSLCILVFYGGVAGIIISIFMFRAPDGTETLPISPTVRCVMSLTCQYFFVYGLLMLCLIVSEHSNGILQLDSYPFYAAVEKAKCTLSWAPMLAVLFVTTRMYALSITNNKGQPQAYVQDGMYMCTWSLLISFTCCLIAGLCMETVSTDRDGHIVVGEKFADTKVSTAMTALRYFTMLLLYGGIITVIIGLFSMTPENANGREHVVDVVKETVHVGFLLHSK